VSGLILREINKKTKYNIMWNRLPYSPMVLSLGILIGLL
jgi:hypothetical protein